jgi:hypothetical protein
MEGETRNPADNSMNIPEGRKGRFQGGGFPFHTYRLRVIANCG